MNSAKEAAKEAAANEATELAVLQQQLGTIDLGTGDPIAGFNLLAAMACTLANMAPDDGTVLDRDRRPARLGTSLLVLGSSGVGRIVDEVICEVGKRQANFTRHYALMMARFEDRQKISGVAIPQTGALEKSTNLIVNCMNQMPIVMSETAPLVPVFETAASEIFVQVANNPKFLVSAANYRDLPSQLTALRPGRPLVHVGLNRPEDISHLADTASALLEGRYPLAKRFESLRGHLLVTDNKQVLARAAHSPEIDTGWLDQLLWLSDDKVGPDAPSPIAVDGQNKDPEVAKRFRIVLTKMMALRAATPADDSRHIFLRTPTRKIQSEWTVFLQTMEATLPGISGACRNLLTSLVFGLGEMTRLETPVKITPEGICALARFLVRRMANTRVAILHAGEVTHRRNQIERVFHKLVNGCTNARQISKTLKICAVERDICLKWLEAAGFAFQREQGWAAHAKARLDFNSLTLPVLDI